MIPQPLPSFNSQFPQKERVGSYKNIALNQQNSSTISSLPLIESFFSLEMIKL